MLLVVQVRIDGEAVSAVGRPLVQQLGDVPQDAVLVETQSAHWAGAPVVRGERLLHDVAAELVHAALAQLEKVQTVFLS